MGTSPICLISSSVHAARISASTRSREMLMAAGKNRSLSWQSSSRFWTRLAQNSIILLTLKVC